MLFYHKKNYVILSKNLTNYASLKKIKNIRYVMIKQ